MEKFAGYMLRSADYMSVFSKLLNTVPRKASFLEFLVNAETTSTRFTRTLLMEESGHAICQPQRADYEGEQVLLLLDRLYFIIEENDENRHCILSLAVSTAVWIAQREGESGN